MIVSDSARAKQVLLEKGYTAVLTPVLVVELQQEVGALSQILDTLSTKGLNLEYMYALVTGKEGGAMVVKTSDQARTYQTLKDAGMKMFSEEELNELKK